MSDDDLTLFETTPVARLQPGDRVRLVTMWGDETGTVRDVGEEDGFPVVAVDLAHGDTVTVNVARVTKADTSDT